MDIRGNLAGAARVADNATESAKNLSVATEDAERTALDLVSVVDRLPEIGGLIHDILTGWGAELHGAVGQAADSAQQLREGTLRLAGVDEFLADAARKTTPSAPDRSHFHRQQAQ